MAGDLISVKWLVVSDKQLNAEPIPSIQKLKAELSYGGYDIFEREYTD